MLVIRLSRSGRRNTPVFSLTVAEKSAPVKSGKIVEKLGTFQIAAKPSAFVYKKDRVEHWISKGARPSETVARLLHKEGFSGMERFVDLQKKYQKRNKNATPEEAKAPEPAKASAEQSPAEIGAKAPKEGTPETPAEASPEGNPATES